MDKLNTYALIAALKGIEAPKEPTCSHTETRKRQNDKWVALQASEMPTRDDIILDPPKEQDRRPYGQRNMYIRQVNDRINQALAQQKQRNT